MSRRVLILRPSLTIGGVETRYLALARALQDQGGRATVLAGGGALAGRMAACADLRAVAWDKRSDQEVHSLIGDLAPTHACAMLTCEPMLLRWVPLLARQLPVVLGVHYRGDRNRMGFGLMGGRRIPDVLRALVDTGRVALIADSSVQAVANARLLGLADDALTVSPNGITMPVWSGEVSAGAVRSVTLLCRLAREKLCHVRAAIELVAEGVDRGRGITLEIYGSGPREKQVRRMLNRALPAGVARLHPAVSDATRVLAEADVVVGTSRASIEAASLGRRVVAAKTLRDHRGQLGPLATPGTFGALAAENFGWRTSPPVRAADVWDQLETVPPSEITTVAERVRRDFTAVAMLARELALAESLHGSTSTAGPILAAACRQLGRPWGGARRLPQPFDLPDRAVFALRRDEGSRW